MGARFLPFFLFASHPTAVDEIRESLSQILSLNTLPLTKIELDSAAPDQTVSNLLQQRPLVNAENQTLRPVFWLELWQTFGTTPEAVDLEKKTAIEVLSRLNERRFLLERDVPSPVVFVLPQTLRMTIPALIPDLWSVRAFTADLPSPQIVAVVNTIPTEVTIPTDVSREVSSGPSAAELEWTRLWEGTDNKQRLTLDTAFDAIEAAIARFDYRAAESILKQIKQVLDTSKDNSDFILRQRSLALDFEGQINQDQQHLDAARSAYAESLQLRRRLLQASGETPQALRELSVSLDNVGEVETALNRYDTARSAYAESLQLCRRLLHASGETPQALRDLSVSLDNVGEVETALNRYDAARSAYAESLQLIERLVLNFPEVPLYKKDLEEIAAHLKSLDS